MPGGELAFILASSSPARLATLRAAGLDPVVRPSNVDESAIRAGDTATLVDRLAAVKANVVAAAVTEPAVVLGCDSMLDLDGTALGKPLEAVEARARWRRMRGRSGWLYTGHALVCVPDGRTARAVGRTRVSFADVSDAEIDAYVASGEPLAVAGAFTVDGLGGWFVEQIDGDPHNVVGVSLPLLRRLFAEVGVSLVDLGWPARR